MGRRIDEDDLIDSIVRAENLFPETFAQVEERPWGKLFVTPTIPESHDGNHACVLNRTCDAPAAVAEITAFYRVRGLGPRVNYISARGDHPRLREALAAAGLELDREAIRIYLQRGASRISPNPEVSIRRVDTVDDDMLATLASINNARAAKVIERRCRRRDCWLFAGEIHGQLASVALLELVDDICRVDEVHTAEVLRGIGCARAAVHALVSFHREHISVPLYLYSDNPIAERIYVEAGFARLDAELTNWGAWLQG